jgi:hypothetical protein
MKKQRVVIELSIYETEVLKRAAMAHNTTPSEFARFATISLINHTATRQVPMWKRAWLKLRGVK